MTEDTVIYADSEEMNVGFYRHCGFALMQKERIPKTPVIHYAMVKHSQESL